MPRSATVATDTEGTARNEDPVTNQPEGTTPDPYAPQQPAAPGYPGAQNPGYPAAPTPGYGGEPATPGYGGEPAPAPGTAPGYPAATGTPSPYEGAPYENAGPYGGAPAPYGAPQSAGTDGFAIGALVTGILTMTIVPIILGAVSLARIKKSGQSGRGMAIAGIVLGALSTIGWIVTVIVLVMLVRTPEFQEGFDQGLDQGLEQSLGEVSPEATSDPGDTTEETEVAAGVDEPLLGTCFTDSDDLLMADDFGFHDCAEPHNAEIYAETTVEGDVFPGDEAIWAQADEFCVAEFATFVGLDYESSELEYNYFYPGEDNWNDGGRLVSCYLVTADGSELTGSAQGSAR